MADDMSNRANPVPSPNASSHEGKSKTKPIGLSSTDALPLSNERKSDGQDTALPRLMAEIKKQTSRVPLGKSETDLIKRSTTRIGDLSSPSAIPQTIRLKRPASVTQQVRTGLGQSQTRQPTDRIDLSEAPTIARKVAPLKRQTSRIILSDVPPPTGAPSPSEIRRAPTEAIPETIRLKRPTIGAGEDTTLAPVSQQQVETAKKSETAKIDLEPETDEPIPITQRKTIKIKRTERNVVPRTVSMARTKAPPVVKAEVARHTKEESDGEEEQDVGAFFSVLAFAATLAVGALVYIMAAQFLAPDLVLPLPSMMSL